jgi:cytochrome c-type biogenesis protein
MLALAPAAYLVAFGAGVSSFLAPCVIPLMPAYVAYVFGDPLDELAVDKRRFQDRLFVGSLLYVLGFAIVFVPLGLAASTLGMALRNHQGLVARVGGALVILLGLQQLGVLRWIGAKLGIHVRPILPRVGQAPKRGGRLRPLVLGIAFGLAWTPCVGPILGAVLVLAAGSATALGGAGLLFAYALGVGLPFLAVSLLLINFPGMLKPLARRAGTIARVAGFAMVVLGVLLASGLYARLTGFLVQLAPGT